METVWGMALMLQSARRALAQEVVQKRDFDAC